MCCGRRVAARRHLSRPRRDGPHCRTANPYTCSLRSIRYGYGMARQFPTHTPLGKRMRLLGWTATDFAAMTSIHPRTLTEYLAGREPLAHHHAMAAAEVLNCDPADLEFDPFA